MDLNVTSDEPYLPMHPSARKCYHYFNKRTLGGASKVCPLKFELLANAASLCDEYPANTGKQYQTQIKKIYDYMEENKLGATYDDFWFLLDSKAFFGDLLAYTMKLQIRKPRIPASMATKRAFLDGWLFLISLVAHLDLDHEYSYPYERVSVLYNGIDYQIQEQTVDMRAEVLGREELLDMIEAHFRTGSEQRAILAIYTCLPLRDDLQLYWTTLAESTEELPSCHLKKSSLITRGKEIYIYIAKSKTIKDGHLYKLTNPRAVKFVFDYLKQHTIFCLAYPFGEEKNSWRICNWTAKMGIQMTLRGPKGKMVTRRAGIDYFRRVNKAAETASDDPVQIGENLADSAHTAMTALKYRADNNYYLPNCVPSIIYVNDPPKCVPATCYANDQD